MKKRNWYRLRSHRHRIIPILTFLASHFPMVHVTAQKHFKKPVNSLVSEQTQLTCTPNNHSFKSSGNLSVTGVDGPLERDME